MCCVFIVFGFLVASHLGSFVSRAVVELPGRRVTAAPGAAVGLGTTGRGVTLTFPTGRART